MPGTEIVRKQTVLGGAAGIALLAFALCYRFYPIHGHIVLRSPTPLEPTATPDATLRSAPQPQAPVPVAAAPTPSPAPAVQTPAPAAGRARNTGAAADQRNRRDAEKSRQGVQRRPSLRTERQQRARALPQSARRRSQQRRGRGRCGKSTQFPFAASQRSARSRRRESDRQTHRGDRRNLQDRRRLHATARCA